MQWSGIQGGAAPFEALPPSLLTSGQPQPTTTQYNLGLKHPHTAHREIMPTGTWGMLEMQGQEQAYEPKTRKSEFQPKPIAPIPTSAGILRPIADTRATPLSRRSDHGPLLEPVYSPFLTPPPQKPLTPYSPQERVEPPHMQKEQKVWEPAPPQFMGWGAPNALPSEHTQADRKSYR